MDGEFRKDGGAIETEAACVAPFGEPPKTIVIIERRTLIGECLARCLAAEIDHPVATFADRESWRPQRAKFRASLIILGELEASAESETDDAIREFVKSEAGVPVVIISDAVDTNRIVNAFHCGARGVIPFDTTVGITVEAIRLALVGGVYVPPALIFSGANRLANGKASPDSGKSVFTARESAVIQALRKGKANKVIASDLRVSESTVKVHIHNVMRKLQVSNRTEAVIKIGELALELAANNLATAM
jgi:DNA-binding NarL/FixJ family response regulator